MKKKILMSLVLLLLLVACKDNKKSTKPFTVGVVFSPEGLGDKSFNDLVYKGLKETKEVEGINFEYKEPHSLSEIKGSLEKLSKKDDDLIIGVGFLMENAIRDLAKKHPEKKYVILDDKIELPNVTSAIFEDQEGAFLMGALSAMMSKTNIIGFIGGMKVPLIQRFENGYIQGAKYINPNIKVISKYTSGVNPFSDPEQGRENTALEIKSGVDVVYHAAGGTGIGVIEEAEKEGIYAIGADTDQDSLAKGTVLTSMVKKLDKVVYRIIKSSKSGNFKGEVMNFNLSNEGIGTTEFKYTKAKIGLDKIQKLEEIKAKIIDKEIKIKSVRL